jgi:NAD+--dinitrogen-reductase ADP-D-ribosyltransferase
MDTDVPQPHRWYTTNLVGVPAPVLASTAFQQHPVGLHIAGTREAHRGLFALLDRSGDMNEAAQMFTHYLQLAFGLEPDPVAPRRWRASYVKLLQSWGHDSNGPAGAVLKGWVESRFGLVPTFHGAPLARFPSPAWVRYLEQKAASRFHSNGIQQQLDLLYEYAQWALQRFRPFGDGAHATLWRGSNDCDEQIVARGSHERRRQWTVRFNSLVSFATSPAQAECFGDWLLETRVPLVKLLFWPGLLPGLLTGEGEVIAMGGDCEVQAAYA